MPEKNFSPKKFLINELSSCPICRRASPEPRPAANLFDGITNESVILIGPNSPSEI
jgi:hypothetical protein